MTGLSAIEIVVLVVIVIRDIMVHSVKRNAQLVAVKLGVISIMEYVITVHQDILVIIAIKLVLQIVKVRHV